MWLFNPGAKNEIIILFNEHKKRNEILKTARQLGPPLLGLPIFIPQKDVFLIINIRRKNLIEDALNELSKPGVKLQNPIKHLIIILI